MSTIVFFCAFLEVLYVCLNIKLLKMSCNFCNVYVIVFVSFKPPGYVVWPNYIGIYWKLIPDSIESNRAQILFSRSMQSGDTEPKLKYYL